MIMLWNENEDEGESALPDLPSQKFGLAEPKIKEENEKNILPAFPDSPIHEGFSQTAIKEAVREEPRLPELPEPKEAEPKPENNIKTIEMEEWTPPEPATLPKPTHREKEKRLESLPSAEKRKEVYVKLEKFRSAKKAIDSISGSVEEIEELLKKIRETKMREEQEFASWEKEVEAIKSRIDNVKENIFGRL